MQRLHTHRSRGLPPPWACCGAFLFVAGCAAKPPPRPAPPKNEIYSVARAAYVDRATLEADLLTARYVLLGEQHDNQEHHELQRALIASLIARGRRPAIVLEMIDVDAQERIDPLKDDLSAFAPGWRWSFYQPIVALARAHHLPVVAGNYPRARIKASFHGAPISPEDRATFALDVELPGRAGLEKELLDSHCGHLPPEMLPGFVDAQRLRDGQMAERMIARGTTDGAVLIAGSGHARTDRGVPWVLRRREPDARVFSLAFVEGKPASLQALPYDAVWITPAVAHDDPCAAHK